MPREASDEDIKEFLKDSLKSTSIDFAQVQINRCYDISKLLKLSQIVQEERSELAKSLVLIKKFALKKTEKNVASIVDRCGQEESMLTENILKPLF